MTFAASLRSEILKTKRTPAVYLMLIASFIAPFALFLDLLSPPEDPQTSMDTGSYFLEGHSIINFLFLQMFIILASTLLMQTEFKNNSWKQVLTSPQRYATIYFSKFLVLQGLVIMLLISFNVFTLIFASLLDLLSEDANYLSYLEDWPKIFQLMARTYVSSLGISAFCYWLAIRSRNFIIPIAVGVSLYAVGPLLLFEFARALALKYFFALPILVILEKYSDNALVYQGLSLGYAVVFLAGGYADFLFRQVSLQSIIPADALGNPFSIFKLRKNIFLISWRSLIKDKYYTLINISGLTIGLVSSLFLLIYILDELSYDRYHKNAGNIYRVISEIKESDNAFTWPSTPTPLAQEILEQDKRVKNAVRFFKTGRAVYRNNAKEFYEENIFLADSTAFDMFSWTFIAGDPGTALDEPASIVLTEKLARKYFSDPYVALGQTIQNEEEVFRITAVIDDIPLNSHFRFDGLISSSTRKQFMSDSWGRLGAFTYLELSDGVDSDDIRPVLDTLVRQKVDPIFESRGITTRLSLQPITSIHLYSKIADEAEAGGDISYVYVFGAVAILILVIACINYMNLTTARSMGRVREVGIRKVVGSMRHQIITQFMLESVTLSFVALGIAVLLIYLLLPGFNFLANKSMTFDSVMNIPVILSFTGITILVGLISGSYPALYLSGFNPADVLKGNLVARAGNNNFRKTLVIIQFSISVFMIIATFIVYNQMEFMRTKDLGFNKEHVVRIPLSGSDQRKNFSLLVKELKLLPNVVDVGMSSAAPGERISKLLLKVEDDAGRFSDRGVNLFFADYNYVKTMDMKIIEGRNFSENIPSDTLYAILVNESMVKRMGWTDPIGKRFKPNRKSKDGREIEKRVVGVVKDYNQSSLYDVIEPMMIVLSDENNDNIFARISPGDVNRSVEAVSDAWTRSFPNDPFEFKFLDQDFDSQYQADQKRSYIFTTFSILTMFIACLGLLGLAAFTTEQRTKEIGLRKIAGASTGNLLILIAKDFFRLIVIAILIAIPLTWYLTNEWLEHFAYRIDLVSEWPTFVVAGAAAMVVTMMTTGYHVIRAARTNPVTALRS
ncbi:MAG TPA: ABC transporter permease [Cyclobacteriaceae bacterium]|nr:ABC transporter permease [Cyclobacteriaceae bacterium]